MKIDPLSAEEEKKGIQEVEQKLQNLEKSNLQASYEKKNDNSGDYADDFDEDDEINEDIPVNFEESDDHFEDKNA